MIHINKSSLSFSTILKGYSQIKRLEELLLWCKSRSETTGSQSILSSASLDTAQRFPTMVVLIYTPTNSSLSILNISPDIFVCYMCSKYFPQPIFPIFLVNRNASRVVKFVNLFLYGQYFMSCL